MGLTARQRHRIEMALKRCIGMTREQHRFILGQDGEHLVYGPAAGCDGVRFAAPVEAGNMTKARRFGRCENVHRLHTVTTMRFR